MPRLYSGLHAAVAITFLIATAACADPVPETVRLPTELTDMQAGRLLIRAGKLEHARAFIEQARPASEAEQIERLVLLGRIEIRLGMPRRAAERFEAALALRPSLTAVRLELARAYYLAGVDDKARYHFSLSQAEELPSSVEATVEEFLRRIDARKRWSISVSASVLPETKRPERETLRIGGVPFRLDEDARASSGAGALASAGISFSPRFTDELRGVFGASAGAEIYRNSQWNDVTASSDVGLARLFEKGSVSAGVRLGRRWTGGDGYNRSVGPWMRTHRRFTGSTHLDVSLNAGYHKHDTRHERDGWRVTASPRVAHALDGRTSIEANTNFEAVSAKRDHHGNRLIGLGVTVARAFAGGLSVSLSSSAYTRQYSAPDPLFGRRRTDRNVRLGIRALHRSFRYSGFAPYIGYSIEQNRSNIPVQEYRRQGMLIGVSRRF